MKINPFSTSGSLWIDDKKNKNLQDTYSVQASKKIELSKMPLSSNAPNAANPQTNSINIKPGEIKNIGSVDGFPLNISIDSDSINTSFSSQVNAYEPLDSPRNQLALELFEKHSSSQRDKAGSISSRFGILYQVANGSMSVSDYNSLKQIPGTISTSQLLTSLGIDVSKPFSFNGRSFSLDSEGNLHTLVPANEYRNIQ